MADPSGRPTERSPVSDLEPARDEPTEESRFVAHLPFTAPDLSGAKRYARMLARTLEALPEVDAPGATVSHEGEPHIHHQLICDRRLDNNRRCVLRADHETPCAARRKQITNQRRI